MKNKRLFTQLTAFFLANPLLGNFFSGHIYQGRLKGGCLPILNCYSCPAAISSCPLGSLQSMAAGLVPRTSLYVLGILVVAAGTAGRWFCGWICPFGLIQDLMGRLTSLRLKIPFILTRIKYILIPLVIILPILWVDVNGFGSPYFCQYICPQGTLTAGIPLLLTNPELRLMIGTVFWVKIVILILIMLSSIFYKRSFCRIICPLGAFLGLFNKYALFKLFYTPENCSKCGRCTGVCPVGLDVPDNLNSSECIRCLACKKECASGLISFSMQPDSVKTKYRREMYENI